MCIRCQSQCPSNSFMKTTPSPSKSSASWMSLILASVLFAGCAENPQPQARASSTGRRQSPSRDDGSTPPSVGMSKEQVRARYGRPTNISSSAHGEVWMYVFNNLDGGDFIPFYGEIHRAMKKRHGGSIIFGGDGRVKDFNWNETDPGGASIFR